MEVPLCWHLAYSFQKMGCFWSGISFRLEIGCQTLKTHILQVFGFACLWVIVSNAFLVEMV